jgi:hypothetical protein
MNGNGLPTTLDVKQGKRISLDYAKFVKVKNIVLSY